MAKSGSSIPLICLAILIIILTSTSASAYFSIKYDDKGNNSDISNRPSWAVDSDQYSLLLNQSMRTIGPVDTYEDYISIRPNLPFHISPDPELTRSRDPEFHPSTMLVFVQQSLGVLLTSELDTYIADLQNAGYTPVKLTVSGGNHVDIKNTILSYYNDPNYHVVGAVLVGDLPVPWFYHVNDFDGNPSSFPCDLYYMDMDGNWTDANSDNKYESHTDGVGDTAPEIFTGRIDASRVPGVEIEVLKSYFGKVHRYWTGQMNRTRYGLTYTDHDWAGGNDFRHGIGNAYDDYDAMWWSDTDNPVNKNDYMSNRVPNASYEFIQLSCHSGATTHYFHTGGNTNSNNLRAAPPEALFYNLFCCSGARFTSNNCLGHAYVMNTGTDSLISLGSTKTGSMLGFSWFYDSLGRGNSFGEALREWFEVQYPYSDDPGGYNDISWYYGMVILGDPSLILFEPDMVYVDDDYGTDTPGFGWTSFADPARAVHRVKKGGTVFLSPGNYTETIYLNKSVILTAVHNDPTILTTFKNEMPAIIVNADNCYISGINITGNKVNRAPGIAVYGDGVRVQNCVIRQCAGSVLLSEVRDATVYDNHFESGIRIHGEHDQNWNSHTIDSSNTVQGGKLKYAVNYTEIMLREDYGQLVLVNCTNSTISDFTGGGLWSPVVLYNSNGCSISNSTFSNNTIGTIISGNNNYLTDNEYRNNRKCGLKVLDGTGNLIVHNNFLNNSQTRSGEQARDDGYGNRFDNGDSGNYWSDNNIIDEDQNGICDSPYAIGGSAGCMDNNPLVGPWGIPLLAREGGLEAEEDEYYQLNLSARNTNEPVVWAMETNATFLTLHTNGTLVGEPLNQHVGNWTVNISIENSQGSDFLDLQIIVLNDNDAPEIIEYVPYILREDLDFYHVYEAEDMDPTNDTLTWKLHTKAEFIEMNATTGNLTCSPENKDVGIWWVNITVNDGNNGTDWQNFSLEVMNENDDPVIETVPDTFCQEEELYNAVFKGFDVDPVNDTLVWTCYTNAPFLKFDRDTGLLSGTPNNYHVGNWTVNVTLEDGKGGKDWVYFIIKVNNTNDIPHDVEIVAKTEHTEGTPFTAAGKGDDPDLIHGDILSFNWYVDREYIESDTNILLNLTVGQHSLTLNVTDLFGGWNSTTIMVNILPKVIGDDDNDDDGNGEGPGNPNGTGGDDDKNKGGSEDGILPQLNMKGSNTLWLALGLALIIFIIVVALLVARKRRKEDEADGEKKKADNYKSKTPKKDRSGKAEKTAGSKKGSSRKKGAAGKRKKKDKDLERDEEAEEVNESDDVPFFSVESDRKDENRNEESWDDVDIWDSDLSDEGADDIEEEDWSKYEEWVLE